MLAKKQDILIKNGLLVTMDDAGRVTRGDLFIQDGLIVGLGTNTGADESKCEVIDGTDRVVLPGFVNAHSHLQQYFRGVYELIGDFFSVNLPLEGYRSHGDMASLGLASCAEFIYGGCTTIQLIYTYPDGFAQAVEKTGLRAVLGTDIEEVDLECLRSGKYVYLPEKGEAAFDRAVALHSQWHGRNQGRIQTVISPKAPDMTSRETFLKCKQFADQHDLRLTTHLSQSWREFQQVGKLHGQTPTEFVARLGLLGDRFSAAHCAFMTETDIQTISRSGSHLVQCLFGHVPIMRLMALGMNVCLGTDDYYHNMFQLMRKNMYNQINRAKLAGGLEAMEAGERRLNRPTCYELLEMATSRGSKALGMEKQIGSLETGKKADVITINMNNPFLKPSQDPVVSVVLYASPGDVDYVIVDGQILKRKGLLTTLDMTAALDQAQEKCDEIIERFFHDHPDQKHAWEDKATRCLK